MAGKKNKEKHQTDAKSSEIHKYRPKYQLASITDLG
jgi:hypothetical protein